MVLFSVVGKKELSKVILAEAKRSIKQLFLAFCFMPAFISFDPTTFYLKKTAGIKQTFQVRPAQLATPKYTSSELHKNKKLELSKKALTSEEPLSQQC